MIRTILFLAALLAATATSAQVFTSFPGAAGIDPSQLSDAQKRQLAEAMRGQAGARTDISAGAGLVPVLPAATSGPSSPTKVDGPARLRPGDSIVIDIRGGTNDQPLALAGSRVAVIDPLGGVTLASGRRIVIGGLTESEAASRLALDPDLAGATIHLRKLALEVPLKAFGYDMFRTAPWRETLDAAVPADYVIGPGDVLRVQLYGKENLETDLPVTREGHVLFPGIGPVPVAGLSFGAAQKSISGRAETQLIGTKALVTMGRLRAISVFVAGDVERPGALTVSGLSTVTNALIAAGGVRDNGSLRNIQLKRGGRLASRFDLYDLLLKGDARGDARLFHGDVIFVPPIGRTAGIAGEVRRPAIYEMKAERSVAELLEMAGGLAPEAWPDGARLERIEAGRERRMSSLDLTRADTRRTALADGDMILVPSVLERVEHAVTLSGHVARPGAHPWAQGMRLADVLRTQADLPPGTDTRYVLIRRERADGRGVDFVDADLTKAWTDRGGAHNVVLEPRDEILVFSLQEDRGARIEPLLAHARVQAAPDDPAREARITGTVHHAGAYPLTPGMRLSGLLRAAGGLTDEAYLLEAELVRHEVVGGDKREQSRRRVALADALSGTADPELKPYDELSLRRIPDWVRRGSVDILGEVRFPGSFPVRRGERLGDVLERAGGFSEHAFPRGAVFVRESLKRREQEQLDRLAAMLERDVLTISATQGENVGGKKEEALAEGRALLQQLKATKAVGRLAIRLDTEAAIETAKAVILEPGDKLFIPPVMQEVTVVGEVYYPTSHLHVRGLDVDDYIERSGGATERANESDAYIVRADGSVTPRRILAADELGPGDTVVVPMKLERISGLKLATDVTQILYNLAVAAASLKTFGVIQ